MNPFDYNNSPTPEMLAAMAKLREAAEALADVFLEISKRRELSLAMTNLEQAVMWANKAITHDAQGQR